MGQKVNPTGLRVSVTKDWRSRWYADRKQDIGDLLHEDLLIRNTVKQRLLADPAMRAALLEANALDQELYEYVREVVYPAALEKAGLPDEGRKDGAQLTHLQPHRYRICRFYNNAVYKQLLKVRRLGVRPR